MYVLHFIQDYAYVNAKQQKYCLCIFSLVYIAYYFCRNRFFLFIKKEKKKKDNNKVVAVSLT